MRIEQRNQMALTNKCVYWDSINIPRVNGTGISNRVVHHYGRLSGIKFGSDLF